jgi:hypothetical protein
MADSKIEFSYDNLRFSCEGDKEWVETQLNKMLSRIPALNRHYKGTGDKKSGPILSVEADEIAIGKDVKGKRGRKPKVVTESTKKQEPNGSPLYEFLKDKKADKNQVRKFLATAVYLNSQGEEKFSSPIISKVLKNAGIEKLVNASDCLNKNEKKGFCIKDNKEFILTDLGIQAVLGSSEE